MGTRTCIDTRELLKEHRDRRNNDPLKHRLGRKQRPDGHKLQLEDIQRRKFNEVRPFLRDVALLEHGLCFYLHELQLDQLVLLR